MVHQLSRSAHTTMTGCLSLVSTCENICLDSRTNYIAPSALKFQACLSGLHPDTKSPVHQIRSDLLKISRNVNWVNLTPLCLALVVIFPHQIGDVQHRTKRVQQIEDNTCTGNARNTKGYDVLKPPPSVAETTYKKPAPRVVC